MDKAIIVSRCSTNSDRQDVSRQTQELTSKYGSMFDIVESISYYKSATKNQDDNKSILNYLIENDIKNVICSEVSRLGRTMKIVVDFMEVCNSNKINIVIDAYGLHTLDKNGEINPIAQAMTHMGATFANMELKQTVTRLASGRAKYIRDGGVLGRKVGSTESTKTILEKHKDVVKFLKQGQSVRNTMKLTGKSSGTVQKVKKLVA